MLCPKLLVAALCQKHPKTSIVRSLVQSGMVVGPLAFNFGKVAWQICEGSNWDLYLSLGMKQLQRHDLLASPPIVYKGIEDVLILDSYGCALVGFISTRVIQCSAVPRHLGEMRDLHTRHRASRKDKNS